VWALAWALELDLAGREMAWVLAWVLALDLVGREMAWVGRALDLALDQAWDLV